MNVSISRASTHHLGRLAHPGNYIGPIPQRMQPGTVTRASKSRLSIAGSEGKAKQKKAKAPSKISTQQAYTDANKHLKIRQAKAANKRVTEIQAVWLADDSMSLAVTPSTSCASTGVAEQRLQRLKQQSPELELDTLEPYSRVVQRFMAAGLGRAVIQSRNAEQHLAPCSIKVTWARLKWQYLTQSVPSQGITAPCCNVWSSWSMDGAECDAAVLRASRQGGSKARGRGAKKSAEHELLDAYAQVSAGIRLPYALCKTSTSPLKKLFKELCAVTCNMQQMQHASLQKVFGLALDLELQEEWEESEGRLRTWSRGSVVRRMSAGEAERRHEDFLPAFFMGCIQMELLCSSEPQACMSFQRATSRKGQYQVCNTEEKRSRKESLQSVALAFPLSSQTGLMSLCRPLGKERKGLCSCTCLRGQLS
eukprot:1158898-Pelagomonas_calceolata.AAC.1